MSTFHQIACYSETVRWQINRMVKFLFLCDFYLYHSYICVRMVMSAKMCELRAILTQTFKAEVSQWRRSEISSLPEHKEIDYKTTHFHLSWIIVQVEQRNSDQLSGGQLCLGNPQPCACWWRPDVGACCGCILCFFFPLVYPPPPTHPPWVCLMQACRPCHVSHTEPNAINVSAHGATLWGRGHERPGGARPEWSPRYSAGQLQQHVSRLDG